MPVKVATMELGVKVMIFVTYAYLYWEWVFNEDWLTERDFRLQHWRSRYLRRPKTDDEPDSAEVD